MGLWQEQIGRGTKKVLENLGNNLKELDLVQLDNNISRRLERVGNEETGTELRRRFDSLDARGTEIARTDLMEHFRVSKEEGIEPDENTLILILAYASEGKSALTKRGESGMQAETSATSLAISDALQSYTQEQREIQEMFRLCLDPDVQEAEQLRRRLQQLHKKAEVRRVYELRKKYIQDFDHQISKQLRKRGDVK